MPTLVEARTAAVPPTDASFILETAGLAEWYSIPLGTKEIAYWSDKEKLQTWMNRLEVEWQHQWHENDGILVKHVFSTCLS